MSRLHRSYDLRLAKADAALEAGTARRRTAGGWLGNLMRCYRKAGDSALLWGTSDEVRAERLQVAINRAGGLNQAALTIIQKSARLVRPGEVEPPARGELLTRSSLTEENGSTFTGIRWQGIFASSAHPFKRGKILVETMPPLWIGGEACALRFVKITSQAPVVDNKIGPAATGLLCSIARPGYASAGSPEFGIAITSDGSVTYTKGVSGFHQPVTPSEVEVVGVEEFLSTLAGAIEATPSPELPQ